MELWLCLLFSCEDALDPPSRSTYLDESYKSLDALWYAAGYAAIMRHRGDPAEHLAMSRSQPHMHNGRVQKYRSIGTEP